MLPYVKTGAAGEQAGKRDENDAVKQTIRKTSFL